MEKRSYCETLKAKNKLRNVMEKKNRIKLEAKQFADLENYFGRLDLSSLKKSKDLLFFPKLAFAGWASYYLFKNGQCLMMGIGASLLLANTGIKRLLFEETQRRLRQREIDIIDYLEEVIDKHVNDYYKDSTPDTEFDVKMENMAKELANHVLSIYSIPPK